MYIFDKKTLRMSLIDKLSNLNFLGKGMTRKPSECFNPLEPMFVEFLDDSYFPQYPFNSREWIDFLKLCGLKQEIDETFVIKCFSGLNNLEKTECIRKSEILLNYMYSNQQKLSTAFYQEIKKVNIIPSIDLDPNVFPSSKESDFYLQPVQYFALEKQKPLLDYDAFCSSKTREISSFLVKCL
jgi:hypothetical protein